MKHGRSVVFSVGNGHGFAVCHPILFDAQGMLVASKSIKAGTGTPSRRRNAISFYNCKPGMEVQRLWFEPSRGKSTDSGHIDLVVRGGRDRVLTLTTVRGSGTSGTPKRTHDTNPVQCPHLAC